MNSRRLMSAPKLRRRHRLDLIEYFGGAETGVKTFSVVHCQCRYWVMPKKRFSAEQIVTLLRQIEVSMAQGKSTPMACRDAGISLQSYVMSC